MAPSQTEIESQIIELADKSFKTFCGDISGMFGMDMVCKKQDAIHETVDDLQMRFENLAVVYSVKTEGILEGTFRMVLDRKGLFILGGVVAMHPGQMILEDITSSSLDKAEKESNVLNEVGTALVGSWDRVFRKGLDGHGRFVLTDTFIGNPWEKVEEKVGLKTKEELVYVPYDMTVGPYPPFKCGAIFPKTIFGDTSESGAGQRAPEDEQAREEMEQRPQVETEEAAQVETEETVQVETEETTETQESAAIEQEQPESEVQEDTEEEAESEEGAATEQAQPEVGEQEDTEEKAESEESAAEQAQPEAEEAIAADGSVVEQVGEAVVEQEAGDVEEQAATVSETKVKKRRPISDAIKKMAKSAAVLPGGSAPSATAEKPGCKDALLAVCAKDVMQKDVVWGSPDDSVQQALSKMQQHNTGYIIIGKKQVAEGIVSKSDLSGALSPYLRNIFAKWRRPLDDATLQIKIKWIMSKPTSTISPDTPLLKIIENMCQIDKKCLPVVDEEGKVRGLVTVFDIFRALLKHSIPM